MPLTLRYVARSEVGLVREGNEDSGYAGPRLLAVADGMGGHAAGEVASSVAIDALSAIDGLPTGDGSPPVNGSPTGEEGPGAATRTTSADGGDEPGRPAGTAETPERPDPKTELTRAVRGASSRMRNLIGHDPRLESMGTTVTAAIWTGSTLVFAHVGDSRAYLWHRNELHRVTHDHTYVQQLIDEGRLTEEEASVHPMRSLILRTLDGRSEPEIDVFTVEVEAGDRLLVCSDGLTAVVNDGLLAEVMGEHLDLDATVARLIELTYAGGAPDNVTCVIAEVAEVEQPPARDDTVEAFLVGAVAENHTGTDDDPDSDVTGSGLAVDDDELERYARRPPSRARWLWRGIGVVVAAALVWGIGSAAYAWTQRQYYVGTSGDAVAIYKGVNQRLGPINLSSLHTAVTDLPVAALAPVYQDQVDETITADDLPQAEAIVDRLRTNACRAAGALPSPSPSAATETPAPTTPAPAGATPTAPPPAVPSPTSAPAVPQPTGGPAGTTAPAPTPSQPAPTTPVPTATPTVPGLVCAGAGQ